MALGRLTGQLPQAERQGDAVGGAAARDQESVSPPQLLLRARRLTIVSNTLSHTERLAQKTPERKEKQ